ncbi:hypothetical protein I4U23_005657 [Adineta vaga]|nr:hypothetical protein I4U23_005657 [Adineta vaga]
MDTSDELEPVGLDLDCPMERGIDCDERICWNYELISCGDGACAYPYRLIITIANIPNKNKLTIQCYTLRDIAFQCEIHRPFHLWTLKGGFCTHLNSLWGNHLFTSEENACRFRLKCQLSGNLSTNCLMDDQTFMWLKTMCTSDYSYVSYPSGPLLAKTNPERSFVRNHSHFAPHFDVSCWHKWLPFFNLTTVEEVIVKCHEYCLSHHRINDGLDDCLSDYKTVYADNIKVAFDETIIDRPIEHYHKSCLNCIERTRKNSICLPVNYIDSYHPICIDGKDRYLNRTGIAIKTLKCDIKDASECHMIRNHVIQSFNEHKNITISSSMKVLPFLQHCDTYFDSETGADENVEYCLTKWSYTSNEYRCLTGQCVPFDWLCDGTWDCSDASDEQGLLLQVDGFTESHNRLLLNFREVRMRCFNRYKNQPFANICNITIEYPCLLANVDDALNFQLNRPCIELRRIGDGHIDCIGKSDERNLVKCGTDVLGWQFGYSSDEGLKTYRNSRRIELEQHSKRSVSDRIKQINMKPYVEQRIQNNNTFMSDDDIVDQYMKILRRDPNMILNFILPFICNRGIPIKLSNERTRCFCSPSYYGDYCEFHANRISVVTHLNLTSYNGNYTTVTGKNATVLVSCTFRYKKHIIDRHEFYIHSIVKRAKQKFYFAYPRTLEFREQKRIHCNGTGLYSVRFEALYLQPTSYPIIFGVWHFPIEFDFLPAFRLAKILRFNNTYSNYSCNLDCGSHGRCLHLQNKIKQFICSCQSGWYGDRCDKYDKQCEHFCHPHAICRPEERGFINDDERPVCLCPHETRMDYMRNNAPSVIIIKSYNEDSSIHGPIFYLVYSQQNPKDSINITVQLRNTKDNILVFKYHELCRHHYQQQNRSSIVCFRDNYYFCLCNMTIQRAQCLRFNPSIDKCQYCLSRGQCIRGNLEQEQDFICLCPQCTYGSVCQLFSFTLDSLMMKDIQMEKNLSIAIYVSITSLIFLIGIFSNLCSLLVFSQKNPRKVRVGNYLLLVSIMNILSLIFQYGKIIHILLGGSELLMDNKINLLLCKLLSPMTSITTRISYWLTSIITIERLSSVLYPAQGRIQKSNVTRLVNIMIVLILCGMHIHEILLYKIIRADPQRLNSTAIICVIDFSNQNWLIYNRFNVFIHHIIPFSIQLISITLMIISMAKSRAKTKGNSKLNFFKILKEKFRTQKERYITPAVIIVAALPQLIFASSFACTELKKDWQRYALLIAYLFSFIPQICSFLIFVLPSTSYRAEFIKTRFGKILIKYLSNSSMIIIESIALGVVLYVIYIGYLVRQLLSNTQTTEDEESVITSIPQHISDISAPLVTNIEVNKDATNLDVTPSWYEPVKLPTSDKIRFPANYDRNSPEDVLKYQWLAMYRSMIDKEQIIDFTTKPFQSAVNSTETLIVVLGNLAHKLGARLTFTNSKFDYSDSEYRMACGVDESAQTAVFKLHFNIDYDAVTASETTIQKFVMNLIYDVSAITGYQKEFIRVFSITRASSLFAELGLKTPLSEQTKLYAEKFLLLLNDLSSKKRQDIFQYLFREHYTYKWQPVLSFLQLQQLDLDPRFNRDYPTAQQEQRGGRPYYFPQGWYRHALKVDNKYPEDKVWLGMNNSPGEWCVAYHGTKSGVVKNIATAGLKHQFVTADACKDEAKAQRPSIPDVKGLYVAAHCEGGASGYTGSGFNVSDSSGVVKKYKIVFQCRVQNDKFTEHKGPVSVGLALRVFDEKAIRPYGILLKTE